MAKKNALPFDSRRGSITNSRYLLESEAYIGLTAQAKTLMTLMQLHWRNDKPVDYGIREAQAKIPCCNKTASKCFYELERNGFIRCIEQSIFSTRIKSKSRTWQLLWMPYKGNPPENDWDTINANKNAIIKKAAKHREKLASN
ncbi:MULTISPECIES: hypothetical protein [Cycloclasticus]|jgi:hypothetical protein|uniref:Helix-turn-helix domain-containing protein n=1 Tax=Cycloclasticus pugetii TaxID=34068 RepID=A0AB33YZX5_9GAMM|nr:MULTISPECIES: hypothetical protein [Cycloclasticus]EPD12680.1 hypothetical protein L196_08744 [Cycloclasticus pugetii]MBV1899837.1 hypothetical protein [Cycloclasticus sp.]|tara:strand:+ start:1164 stop:1592 length:429 start_codon:yes stop_codon:yes gene_type:complete